MLGFAILTYLKFSGLPMSSLVIFLFFSPFLLFPEFLSFLFPVFFLKRELSAEDDKLLCDGDCFMPMGVFSAKKNHTIKT